MAKLRPPRAGRVTRRPTLRAPRRRSTSNGSRTFHRYPGGEFRQARTIWPSSIAYSAILDLLVADYAEKAAQERDVAVGFIRR